MKKQSNPIKQFFSLFSYKGTNETTNFYIPEVNEAGGSGQPASQEGNQAKDSGQPASQQGNQAKDSGQPAGQQGNQAKDSGQPASQQGNQAKDSGEPASQQGNQAKDSGGKGKECEQKENQQAPKDRNIKIKKPIPVSEFKKKKEAKQESTEEADNSGNSNNGLMTDIQSNINLLKKEFNSPVNVDLVIREFLIDGKTKAFLVYMEGMVDRITINNFILSPILTGAGKFRDSSGNCQLDMMFDNVLETHQVKKVRTINEAIVEILVGDTGIYADGCDYLIFCETKGYEKRSVSTPQIESVVRGAQEGFNENLRTNITLIRRNIKDKDLTTEFLSVGDKNKLNVGIMYINGVINTAIVAEVKRRLNGVKTDYISSSGMLEQFIEDTPFSIIPTVLATERPDRTASHIVEGKLAILFDGSPYSIIVPVTVSSLFHSPEDSSLRWQYGTMMRLVRIFAIFVATMLPGLYVALTTFHIEMIPTDLLIAIAKARENVPFPTIVEVVLMEVSFELIREAGIRIPGIVGNTIGIIGALILGQAAVQANLVSPVMIIVIAFTGLGNFAIPDYSLAFGVRILRVFFVFAGAFLGFYGISLALVAVGYTLVSLKSFGIPFFSTFAPRTSKSHDVLLHWPVWKQEHRPDNVNPEKVIRQPHISRKWTKQKPISSYDKEDGNE